MAELRLEERFGELSERAEALHDKVYRLVKIEVPYFEKRDIYTDRNSESPGCIIPRLKSKHLWSIGLNPSVAEFNEEYEKYLIFEKNQREKMRGVSVEDFFEYVVAHEYGHLILYNGNPFKIIEMYGDFGLEDERIVKRYKNAVDEAFAHWFCDSISGIKDFNSQRALSYCSIADARLLKEMYEVYSKEEKEKGRKFVLENHEDIAVRYVDQREELF